MKVFKKKYMKYCPETLKKMKDKQIFKILMEQKIHLGHHRQNIKKEFKTYLHSFFNDYGIINLKKTLMQLRIVMNIVFNLGLKNGNILIIDSFLINGKSLDLSIPFEGILCLKQSDWIPGLLSNKKHVKNAMKQNLSKKNIKTFQKDLSETLLNHIDSIDLIVIIDPLACIDIINEASITNTPIIALVDLNGFLQNIDYPIICNNQNRNSVLFILQLLFKAYEKGTFYQNDVDKKIFMKKKRKNVSTYFEKQDRKKDFIVKEKKKNR